MPERCNSHIAVRFSLLLVILITVGVIIYFACQPVASQFSYEPTLDVRIGQIGTVRGRLAHTFLNEQPFYDFRGIPYARPPVDQLRFRPPQPLPANAWGVGVRNSYEHGANCMQNNGDTLATITGSEDCLTLNVYAPLSSSSSSSSSPLAVMVYLNGGAWYRNSADSYTFGPDFLIEQNIVLVTVNHRIGVLGFLASHDADDPHFTGNWGLKDQQLALRWVHDHIAAFGGDPRRVTLFGQSSGSQAAQLHQFAAGSVGLFQRTIQMSTSFDGRAVYRPPQTDVRPVLMRLIGDTFGDVATQQVGENSTAMMLALQQVPAEELVLRLPFVQFRTSVMPIVEPPHASRPFVSGADPAVFALEAPFDMEMDVLTGVTSNEAISQSDAALFEAFRRGERPVDIPSVHFRGPTDYNTDKYRSALARIRARYFRSGGHESNATLEEYVRLLSDVHQSYPLDRKVRQLAAHNRGRTHAYVFDLDTALNNNKRALRREAQMLPGASHSDEICYVFYCGGIDESKYENSTMGSFEYRMIERMAVLFGRFARGEELGWSAVGKGEATVYLDIGMNGWTEKHNWMGEGRQFWDAIVGEWGDEQIEGELEFGGRNSW